jgi:serine/threonine protein phosphatase PrpC
VSTIAVTSAFLIGAATGVGATVAWQRLRGLLLWAADASGRLPARPDADGNDVPAVRNPGGPSGGDRMVEGPGDARWAVTEPIRDERATSWAPAPRLVAEQGVRPPDATVAIRPDLPTEPILPGGRHRPEPVPAAHRAAWLRGGSGDFMVGLVVNTVGSADDADIVLDEGAVAPKHAEIAMVDGGWVLRALAAPTTRNHTNVPVGGEVRLGDGDRLTLGDAELVIVLPDEVGGAQRLVFEAAGVTDPGERQENQDERSVGGQLLVIADGVGGRPGGGLAAKVAVDAVVAARDVELGSAVGRANAAVRARGAADPRVTGMATTLDVVRLRREADGYLVEGTHVGDGIVLLQRGGSIEVLTTAHTLLGRVTTSRESIRSGADLGRGGALVRAVGLADEVRPDQWQRIAERADRYVLASDGLITALSEDVVLWHLSQLRERPPKECADALLRLALRAGAPDNVTVVVADVEPRRADRCASSGRHRGGGNHGALDRGLPPAVVPDGAAAFR